MSDDRYEEYLGNTEDVKKVMKAVNGRRIREYFEKEMRKADEARTKALNRQLWGGGYKSNA